MQDFTYIDGDQPEEAGDYETTNGAWPSMVREMSAEYEEEFDERTGETVKYGNRVWAQTERGFDSPQDRELVRRYYQEVGERYVRTGQIEDLEVTVGDPVARKGQGVWVKCFDVQAGRAFETDLKAWAHG